jgi:hypothetical protein
MSSSASRAGVVVVRDDEGDLLALEAHLVGGQDRLRVADSVGIHASPCASRSFPVMTARTLGCWSAAEVSIDLMRAWASGLRSAAPCSMPRQVDVVDVVALAADEARVLLALHPAEADGTVLDGHQAVTSSPCSAAQRIAAMMFL